MPSRLDARAASFVVALVASLSFCSTALANDDSDDEPTYRTEHFVQLGAGRSMHVTETFSARSFERQGHPRAMVMLPGPLTDGEFFNIEVPGYDAGVIMARHGFFAYAVDFEGTGLSSYPAQGTSATLSSQVDAVKQVVDYVQDLRGVRRVDMLGESWGGGVAAEVCADKHSVRSCILASMIYKTPSAVAAAEFQSPAWLAFLQSLPNAYLPTSPTIYQVLVPDSIPAVQQWTFSMLPGLYSAEPLFEFFDLPFFDPTVARVPGLIIQGEDDPQSVPSDTVQLATDYGEHGAALVTIAGGGHVPRIEPVHNDEYWNAVTSFVDRQDDDDSDSE
jgi:pimeloyl-ACP methyl ester carboxylesterase